MTQAESLVRSLVGRTCESALVAEHSAHLSFVGDCALNISSPWKARGGHLEIAFDNPLEPQDDGVSTFVAEILIGGGEVTSVEVRSDGNLFVGMAHGFVETQDQTGAYEAWTLTFGDQLTVVSLGGQLAISGVATR